MKKLFLFLCLLTLSFASLRADDLKDLQGKWTVTKKNSEGQTTKQTLEITKNKLVFKMLSESGELRFMATAEIELKKLGPFKAMRLASLKAGGSESDLSDVEDDYQLVYLITDDGLSVASNMDKDREDRKPTLDTYKKAN